MIGERLADIRKDRGMSQQKLADMLSLTKYAISSYERNKTVPSDDIKIKIAKTLDISIDYLIGLIDEPISYKRNKKCIILPDGFTNNDINTVKTFVNFINETRTK